MLPLQSERRGVNHGGRPGAFGTTAVVMGVQAGVASFPMPVPPPAHGAIRHVQSLGQGGYVTVDMGDTTTERQQRQAFNEHLWAAYGNLTAVRTRRLRAATTDALVVPGPRIVEAAEWIAALLDGTATR